MANAMLYAYGFDGDEEHVQAEVDAIGAAAFDVVIVPFLHIHPGGVLYLNDTAVSDLFDGWADKIEQLKSGFDVKKRVLLSIGGADNEGDWASLAADIPGVVAKIVEFAKANNIDGVDLDFEGGAEGTDWAQVLGKAASEYKQQTKGGIVTAAPFGEPSIFWTGPGGVLSAAAEAAGGESPFAWWNVQFYEGEIVVGPESYASVFENWADAVGAGGNGVADKFAFVAPGCNAVDTGFTPGEFEAGLSSVKAGHPAVPGGFVWEYSGLGGTTPAEWADAVHTALG